MYNFISTTSEVKDKDKLYDFKDFMVWFDSKKDENHFNVERIPFHKLDNWSFDSEKTCIKHSSGKFFSIEGISVHQKLGTINQYWEQPIINQPEIGILGIITKVFNNTRYFLMQAKMEPGNVNLLQLSPTVQATKSNYTKVHKGKLPLYLEYFIKGTKAKVLIDQLQPEQGGRFIKKRNRNMIVEITDEIEVHPDFFWLTLTDIKKLLLIDDFVNMDARSVISTIINIYDQELSGNLNRHLPVDDFRNDEHVIYTDDIISSIQEKNNSWKTLNDIISWYVNLKSDFEQKIERIKLSEVKGWSISDNEMSHESKKFFSVIAVSVEAGTREVTKWTQPLLAENKIGLIGFISTKINGVLHFLVQGKVEPGNFDVVDIAPTVSFSDVNSNAGQPFMNFFNSATKDQIIYSAVQSEEGGRFYHFRNRNMIIFVDDIDEDNIPNNYAWLTLSQMSEFLRFGLLNIEARNLVSYINLI